VDPALHPQVQPIAFLLGVWRGQGKGEYPTIEPFRFGEEMRFEHVGEPYLVYAQRSSLLDDGSPLHLERGFVRVRGDQIELTLAHPLGLTEIAEGPLDGTAFDVRTGTVGRTTTGSAVTGVRRRYRAEGDRLTYELDMEMLAVPMTQHLEAELRRDRS
jgi:hypothetical protein